VVSYLADLEGTVVTCLSQSQIIWLAEMTYAESLQKVCGCVGSRAGFTLCPPIPEHGLPIV